MSLEDLSAEALADIEANVFVSVHMDSPEKDAKLAKKYLTKYNVEVQPSWSDQETVHRAIALRHQKTAAPVQEIASANTATERSQPQQSTSTTSGQTLTRVRLPRQKANQQFKSKVE